MTDSPRRRRLRRTFLGIVALGLAAVLVGSAALYTDTLGARHILDRVEARVSRFLAGPVPDRVAPVTVVASDDPSDEGTDPPDEIDADGSPAPSDEASPTPTAGVPSASASPAGSPTAAPRPAPARVAVDVDIVKNHDKVFAHEIKDTWCASAGVQMVLAIHRKGNTSHAFQRELQGRVREWESYKDSHNGDWGPSAMALALDAYGVKGYEVRGYKTRQGALRGAAKAIEKTGSPVDPARLARRPHLGHDRLQSRCRPGALRQRDDQGHLHPRPLVPGRLEHLGPVGPARDLPEHVRDGAQLPQVEATGGSSIRSATACTSRSCRRSSSSR